MKYIHLYDNLSLIFNICGAMTQEQAVRFFGDKDTEDNVRFYVKKLAREGCIRRKQGCLEAQALRFLGPRCYRQ